MIDCKVCSTSKGFDLNRVEENQHYSMDLWRDCGNGEAWFAVKLKGQIYMIPHITIKALSAEKATLRPEEIYEYGVSIFLWIKRCE